MHSDVAVLSATSVPHHALPDHDAGTAQHMSSSEMKEHAGAAFNKAP